MPSHGSPWQRSRVEGVAQKNGTILNSKKFLVVLEPEFLKMPTPRRTATPDYRALFESAPGLFLVLDVQFRVIAGTGDYLQATKTRREEIIGRSLFDVFPAHPTDVSADLRTSLETVLE